MRLLTGDGAIWRGDLRTGSGTVMAPGARGRVSLGITYEAARDRLWVAIVRMGNGTSFAVAHLAAAAACGWRITDARR